MPVRNKITILKEEIKKSYIIAFKNCMMISILNLTGINLFRLVFRKYLLGGVIIDTYLYTKRILSAEPFKREDFFKF